MKFFYFLFLCLLIPALGQSQQRERPQGGAASQREMFEIKGVIHEKEANIPLEFATIIVKPLKGDRVFGGMSNANGKFSFEVPKGTYHISFMNFYLLKQSH